MPPFLLRFLAAVQHARAGVFEEDVVQAGAGQGEGLDLYACCGRRRHDLRHAGGTVLHVQVQMVAVEDRLAGDALLLEQHREVPFLGSGFFEEHHNGITVDAVFQFLRAAHDADAAVVDDGHAMGQFVGLFQVVGGEEDGEAVIAVEVLDQAPQALAAADVQSQGGLVQEEDARAVDEGGGDVQLARHAPGIGADRLIQAGLQFEMAGQFFDAGADVRFLHAVEMSLQGHVLAAGEEVVHPGLLGHHTDGVPHPFRITVHVDPSHQGPPRIESAQGGEDADGGGLAGSVGPQQGHDFPFAHGQVQAVHRFQPGWIDLGQAFDFDRVLRHVPSQRYGRCYTGIGNSWKFIGPAAPALARASERQSLASKKSGREFLIIHDIGYIAARAENFTQVGGRPGVTEHARIGNRDLL